MNCPLVAAILLIQAGDALTQCLRTVCQLDAALAQFANALCLGLCRLLIWKRSMARVGVISCRPRSAIPMDSPVTGRPSSTTLSGKPKSDVKRKQATRKLQAMAASLLAVEEDQALGASVQKMLMPEAALNLKGLTVAHDIRPSLMLTGDFIQYSSIRAHEVLFCLADVSGHGTGSALVTVLLNEQVERLVLMAARRREPLGRADDGANQCGLVRGGL